MPSWCLPMMISREWLMKGTHSIITLQHTTPYHTTSHHTTPHHTTPHHTTSHHTTSHHTTPQHSTPHHITAHHTTPHRTAQHHNTPRLTPHYFTPIISLFSISFSDLTSMIIPSSLFSLLSSLLSLISCILSLSLISSLFCLLSSLETMRGTGRITMKQTSYETNLSTLFIVIVTVIRSNARHTLL